MKIGKWTVHKSVTEDRVIEAAKTQMYGLENPGICLNCGEDADECEPDAREYKCDNCGNRAVYGAEELVLLMVMR